MHGVGDDEHRVRLMVVHAREPYDVRHMTSGMSHEAYDVRHMTSGISHEAYDVRHMAYDVRHIT